jgi:hypothetical protein
VGAFVIRDGVLRWRPAVDVNRIVLVAQLVVVTALLTLRLYLKLRVRRASATVPAEPRTLNPVRFENAAHAADQR